MSAERDVLPDRKALPDVQRYANTPAGDMSREIDRLRAENEKLREDLGRRDDFLYQMRKTSAEYEEYLAGLSLPADETSAACPACGRVMKPGSLCYGAPGQPEHQAALCSPSSDLTKEAK